MKYEIHKGKFGDIEACDSCGCEVPTSVFPNYGPPFDEEKQDRLLCEFCASTLTGNYTKYSATDEFSALRTEIWKSAAAVANYIKFGGEKE